MMHTSSELGICIHAMRHTFLCIAISIALINLSHAQKHDNVWINGYYYDNYYIDFIDFPPNIYRTNGHYELESTIISMSDTDGKPLFYSNGCSIRNAAHEQLDNGDSLLIGDYYCTQKNTVNMMQGGFSLPGFQNKQYLMLSLSTGYPLPPQPCEVNRLVAHYIDMSANQGGGSVTIKSQVLLNGCFQAASANRHANGRDWWILLGDNQQGKFYRWLFTPQGLQGPWEQVMDDPLIDGYWFCGRVEFSPDGEKYMINGCRKGVVIYDFDRCSGQLSNPYFIERTTLYNQAASFSPDSKKLYTVNKIMSELLQYDLEATDVNASKEVLAVWDGTVDSFGIETIFSHIQEGPDGKIYVWAGGSYYMHLINFPNRLGAASDIRQHAIQLPDISANPSIYFPHYRLGPIDESSCDTLGINNLPTALFRYDIEDTLSPLQVTFTDVSAYLPTSWHWDFGDGTVSLDTNPVHTYANPGAYNVCLIVSNAYAADTFCRQVLVGTSGIHELPALPHCTVMPNPFSESLTVQLPVLVGVAPQFVLSDLYGRKITELSLHDFETRLSLPGLPAGVYVWQLLWSGVQTQAGKLVKL